MPTILHAADLHLDSPFRSLPPREAQARRAAQRETLEALRDLALERRADLVLLAGDLFDSQEVYPETLEALTRTLGQMPCSVCIAPGNHDYYAPQSPYARPIWPDNVHIFTTQDVTARPFPELGVTVYGCAFVEPFRDSDPLAGFRAPEGDTLPIGLFHGEVGRQGRYAPIAPESLGQSGLAYAALGHVHAPAFVQEDPTPWAYPGCTQGRGFDELGERGCCLVQLETDGALAWTFCPLPGPRYRELFAPLNADLAGALADYPDDYVRLTLTGEGEAPDLPAIQARLKGLCRTLELRDETTRPREVWARLEEDTLTGHFLREMAGRLDAANEADRPLLERALAYGLAALEGREEPR